MSKTKEKIIIEDIFYHERKDDQYVGLAKECFYYQFLKDREDINPEDGRIADTFAIYQEIYCYMANRGYLFNKKYLLETDETNKGVTFTLDLSKLMEEVDLENELYSVFPAYAEYIHTLCNPPESLRCGVCGAITLSRPIVFRGEVEADNLVFCLSCYPLDEFDQKHIKEIYKAEGIEAAVSERLAYIEDLSRPIIASGETKRSLLDKYRYYATQLEDYRVKTIRYILEDAGLTNYDVFSTADFQIVLWDIEELSKQDNFDKCVATNSEGTKIIFFFNRAGVVLTDAAAIEFAKALTDKEPYIVLLEI